MTDPLEILRALTFDQNHNLVVVSKNKTTATVIGHAEYRELADLGLVTRTNGHSDRLTDLWKAVMKAGGRIVKRKRPTP